MFGEQYVRRIDFSTLTGNNYQSQYNEWQADSLIVAVSEAQETTGSTSSWKTRHNAYEHLKDLVDPGNSRMEVKRKSIANSQERIFSSVFIATNHNDAVMIPAKDRRLAVLSNGSAQTEQYWSGLREWMRNPANIGAFKQGLREIDMTGYNPFATPPMTMAKSEMVFAGASELDRAMDFVMAGFKGVLLVKEQVHLAIEDYLAHNSVEMPNDWDKVLGYEFNRRTRKLKGSSTVHYENKHRVVRALPSADIRDFDSTKKVVAELEKNGPVSRSLGPNKNVVSFKQRGK